MNIRVADGLQILQTITKLSLRIIPRLNNSLIKLLRTVLQYIMLFSSNKNKMKIKN